MSAEKLGLIAVSEVVAKNDFELSEVIAVCRAVFEHHGYVVTDTVRQSTG